MRGYDSSGLDVKKGSWARLLYRAMLALAALASIVFGARGVIEHRISSGSGSWAKAPWQLEGLEAVLLGVVFVLFGLYLLVVVIRSR